MLDLDLIPKPRRTIPALSRLLTKLHRWRARRTERRLVARSLAALATLDDALLKDIGFHREGADLRGPFSRDPISRIRIG